MNFLTGSIERRVWFWAVLGPLLVLLTLFVATVGLSFETCTLTLVGVVGIPLSCLWGRRGLVASLSMLSLTLLSALWLDLGLWFSGAALSVGLGFTVAHLAYEEVCTSTGRLKEEREAVEAQLADLQHEFIAYRERAEHAQRIERIKLVELGALQEERNALLEDLWAARRIPAADPADQRLIAELQAEVEQERSQRESLRQELESGNSAEIREANALVEEVKGALLHRAREFHERQEALREELREAREEIDRLSQSSAELEELRSLVEQRSQLLEETRRELGEVRAEADAIVEQYKDVAASKEAAAQLHQLRRQFEEKNRVLGETRVQVWRLESELLKLKHESEEQALQPDPTLESLAVELANAEAAREAAEAEVVDLEALVDSLLSELRQRSVPGLNLAVLQ